jgi:hypothetical protein
MENKQHLMFDLEYDLINRIPCGLLWDRVKECHINIGLEGE